MEFEYPKIETLFERNPDFTADVARIRCPEFSQISKWLVTEKIDGTNIRVVLTEDGAVRFYGRTDNAQIPTFLFSYLQGTFTAPKLQSLWRPDKNGEMKSYKMALYGEGYGARIQKGGGNYRQDVAFRLFDVLVADQWWLSWDDVEGIARKLGILPVPVMGEVEVIPDIVCVAREGFVSLVAEEDGGVTSSLGEGVVARTNPYLFDKNHRPLRFKLKMRDFKGGTHATS